MKKKKSIALWAVLFWLLVWQLGSMALHRDILLVSPVRVAQTLLELAGTRRFWASIGGSLVRIDACGGLRNAGGGTGGALPQN